VSGYKSITQYTALLPRNHLHNSPTNAINGGVVYDTTTSGFDNVNTRSVANT